MSGIGSGFDKQRINDFQKSSEIKQTNAELQKPSGFLPVNEKFLGDSKKIESNDFGKAFPNLSMFAFDAKDFVETIRNSSGEKREFLMLNFKNKVDNLSTDNLKDVRDYLVNALSDTFNKDDKFLGNLLKVVNQEIDSRGNGHEPINIIKPGPMVD